MFAAKITRPSTHRETHANGELRNSFLWSSSTSAPRTPKPPALPPIRPKLLQTKLKVGSVDDPLEREADRIADHVMRDTPLANPSSSAPRLQRKCAACEKEDEENTSASAVTLHRKCAHCQQEEEQLASTSTQMQRKCAECEAEEQALHRKPTSARSITEAPPLVHDVLRSPGQSLSSDDRSFFEPRFGFDFSRIRIHADSKAAESAGSIAALAYTVGSDIAFASGQYQPGTDTGRRLLAHELAHVGQQHSGDQGVIRRMGDVHKVPAGLSCRIPDWKAPANEFVLFPNLGTTLGAAEKTKIGAYVNRHHDDGPNKAVRVDGYASEPGDDSLNWKLSCLRATAVKNELMHPSAPAKYPGLSDGAINLFMQGETTEFGPEAQNRRATISDASQIIPVPQTTTGGGGGGGGSPDPKDAGVGQYPPPLMSCAVNSGCPDNYCKPFPTLKEALDDRASDGESVLSTIATANAHAEPLFRRYVFSPGPAGDISAEYGSDFGSS